jgi:hypothetical protein
MAAVNAREAGQKFDQEAFNTCSVSWAATTPSRSFALPLTIPPADIHLPRDDWQNIGTNLMQTARTGELNPAVKFYAKMVTAYRSDQPADFNQAVANTASGWQAVSRPSCARRTRNFSSARWSRFTRP